MRRVLTAAVLSFGVACAARAPVMPPAPSAPAYPDYLYPELDASRRGTPLETVLERGWRYLQSNELRSAREAFTSAVKTDPAFHPGHTALGYTDLARKEYEAAAQHFQTALSRSPDYVPALVGHGQAALEDGRDADALDSFEAALARNSGIEGLESRVQVLRFRAMQADLSRAQTAAEQGDLTTARAAYTRAVAASPDSGFLHRELGSIEVRAGNADAALGHLRRAVEIDPGDARAHAAIGELLSTGGDPGAALDALERAAGLDPASVPADRLVRAREAAALARLPAEYRAIPSVDAATRGDVAALVGVRLDELVTSVQPRPVIITDVRGHWAQPWITAVVRAGMMDTLPNSSFQPGSAVRRGELAQTVSRALTLIARRHPARADRWRDARLKLPDVSPRHLAYPAVTAAVASGVMPLGADGAFDLLKPVSGAEAAAIIERLEALAAP